MSKDKKELIEDLEWLEGQYWEQERSIGDIAKELGTYANKIRRALLKGDRGLRDKSAAQSVALKSGRHKHPTEGTVRPDTVKRAISASVAESWENITDKERARRAEVSREQWNNKSEAEIRDIREKAIAAVRETAKTGSKLEKFVQERLTEAGYVLECHKTGLIANHNLEIDIYLPEITTVIEIDGPSHFLPIWGQEALQKTIKSDNEKNGLVLHHGFRVVRVKQVKRNVSINDMWQIWEALEPVLERIKLNPPKNKADSFIEIEVENTSKREVE